MPAPEPCAICQPKEWERWRERRVIVEGQESPRVAGICEKCRSRAVDFLRPDKEGES